MHHSGLRIETKEIIESGRPAVSAHEIVILEGFSFSVATKKKKPNPKQMDDNPRPATGANAEGALGIGTLDQRAPSGLGCVI
jgi:hypothetical protein